MLCPACNEEMVILELEDVEIDYCVHCRGVWLDGGELEMISRRAAGEAAVGLVPGGKRGRRRCPRCRKRMRVTHFEGSTVEVDACPRGDGVWFDRGELEAVLRESGAGGTAEVVRGFFGRMFGGVEETGKDGEQVNQQGAEEVAR